MISWHLSSAKKEHLVLAPGGSLHLRPVRSQSFGLSTAEPCLSLSRGAAKSTNISTKRWETHWCIYVHICISMIYMYIYICIHGQWVSSIGIEVPPFWTKPLTCFFSCRRMRISSLWRDVQGPMQGAAVPAVGSSSSVIKHGWKPWTIVVIRWLSD